jgi:thiamine pyrophosphate-dependent acetolactate synthase large subunit-like protein
VNLDAGMQEERLAEPLPPLETARFLPPVATAPAPAALAAAVALLKDAGKIVILAGRAGRDTAAWARRVQLAETLGARVATDLKQGACFPTDHPLHLGVPGSFPDETVQKALAEADVVLSLDWMDLGGALRVACGGAPRGRVIQASLDHQLHNGWSMDYQALPAVDVMLAAEPDAVVAALIDALVTPGTTPAAAPAEPPAPLPGYTPPAARIHIDDVALALRHATAGEEVCLTHVSLSWNGAAWPFRHPLDYLGSDGGGGIGAGPGLTVGAALALRESGRLVVGVCGDGDFLMGATALWTAVHYRLPLLIVVANNQSFYNDEVHQERVARLRHRPVENKWIGQKMIDPEIDMAGLARAQGALGLGPVREGEALLPALREAVAAVKAGGVAVVDVHIQTGYTPAMAAALTRAE